MPLLNWSAELLDCLAFFMDHGVFMSTKSDDIICELESRGLIAQLAGEDNLRRASSRWEQSCLLRF